MTDTPRPTAGGLTWDQCLSVAYEGCAEVLAKRVQELERDLAAAESRGYVRALREAAEALDADLQHAIDELHEGRTPFGGDTLHRFAYGARAHIAARLDALAREVDRG